MEQTPLLAPLRSKKKASLKRKDEEMRRRKERLKFQLTLGKVWAGAGRPGGPDAGTPFESGRPQLADGPCTSVAWGRGSRGPPGWQRHRALSSHVSRPRGEGKSRVTLPSPEKVSPQNASACPVEVLPSFRETQPGWTR